MTIEDMQLRGVLGFEGGITDGLLLLPDKQTLAYALGSTIVLREKTSVASQRFLHGHTDKISCLAVSKSGSYLASGQVTHMGFIADVILWNLDERKLVHRMQLHKARVQAVDISFDDRYLISLGGEDDNSLVLWDMATGSAICGSPTDGNLMQTVRFLNRSSATVVVAGHSYLSIWDYDRPNNKLRSTEIQLGQLRRVFASVHIDADDAYVYAATTSGDIFQADLQKRVLTTSGPSKKLIPGGATSVFATNDGRIFVGCGDGSVKLLIVSRRVTRSNKSIQSLREVSSVHLHSGISSTSAAVSSILFENEDASTTTLLIGTQHSDIYRIVLHKTDDRFTHALLQTSHNGPVNDIAFPNDAAAALFATCGIGDIRLWHLPTCRELLRIVVSNVECHCLVFASDGSSIFSGWSDGAIRVFRPQSGRLVCKRPDAHHRAIRSLASTHDGRWLVTGSEDGTVRVWRLLDDRCDLVASMKEHKSAVTSIRINHAVSDEFASCSEDGSCVVWDFNTFHRRNSFGAPTCFKAIVYHPEGSQIVSTGTDRKIAYWDPFDGQAIRMIDGSPNAPLHALAVDDPGNNIVSGGRDATIRLWHYDEGTCYAAGRGHSGCINSVAIRPDRTAIVSVGTEGGIFIWNFPPATDT